MAENEWSKTEDKDAHSGWVRWRRWIILIAGIGIVILCLQEVFHLWGQRSVDKVALDGVTLRLVDTHWVVDQMAHHEQFPKPSSMMPDMPPPGVFRLNAQVSLFNGTPGEVRFRARELFLRSGTEVFWPAMGLGTVDAIELRSGQSFNLDVHFDVAEAGLSEAVALTWRRGAVAVTLDRLNLPEHFHLEEVVLPAVGTEWPSDADDLTDGVVALGEVLYLEKFGCVSCHGHPAIPASHTVGPHLAGLGRAAESRVTGRSARDYVYDSVLRPNAFIASGCLDGPCDSPSAMPPFGDLLSPEEMGHLLAFLLSL